MENINSLRHAIDGLAPTPQMRRYPVELRARIRAFVLRHPEETLGTIARQLDMAPGTLERFLDENPPDFFTQASIEQQPQEKPAPIEPAKASELMLEGPHGIIVRGLRPIDIAEILKAMTS